MSIAIGNLCYAYYGTGWSKPTFDDAYNQCSGDKATGFNGASFDYGRLAAFLTPSIYICVQRQLGAWQQGISPYQKVLIGAHTQLQSVGDVLTDFVWARTNSMDNGCPISTNQATGASVSGGSLGWNVLTVDPANPYQFSAYNQNVTGMNVNFLCEYGKPVCYAGGSKVRFTTCTFLGCGTPPAWGSTPRWDTDQPMECNMTVARADAGAPQLAALTSAAATMAPSSSPTAMSNPPCKPGNVVL